MAIEKHRIDTRLIHAGEPEKRICGAVSLPVFQSSTFEYAGQSSYDELKYIRMNNTPNHKVLHRKLAALENADAALVTASGMAAISTTLLALFSPGDHILVQNCLYGGTQDFITSDFTPLGFQFDFIDADDPASWTSKLKPNTRGLYAETITNPLLQVGDLKALAGFAKANSLISMIDNTFATPVNFRPAEWGYDICLHSCTKYLNGHSDIVAGAVIGKGELLKKISHKLIHLGGSLDPHACFLLHRGMKTLALRVRHQNRSALAIAKYLAGHPAIDRVNYPGLPAHPGHERAKGMLEGFGGMVSFELKGGVEAAERFMERVTVPIVAPSLGGVETLVTRPATTSHAGMSVEERQAAGITDSLIRLSVGIEDTQDLINDFDNALRG
ncbi:MAG: aminotransferase class I/II-fold pyridoxal phosphate-dependent enzyme [Desulfosarcina sp.]|nr:aminotransferase class I/II-fold pyridoxal phosphate-dependent enzyme [Desulfosarcina sp.]MBC2744308.1 aminotransferase class I/II-fold pyridoxal phosphate-dependent enzyme [Desulfosarcina sp.]MBC2767217.1 aminotransferase class I/II-fold pyridoxal phosphate-dependent enzyme [Desulfosarcina sp.]